MTNPFNPKHPVEPIFFVNRKEILNTFIRTLKRSVEAKPDNLAVLGDWGLGKTSVLRKFESIALTQLKGIKIFSAFVELTPATSKDFTSFITRVRDEIERSFKVVDLPILAKLKKEIIPNWRIRSVDFGITLERREQEKRNRSSVTIFEDTLRDLWETLVSLKIDIVLLCIDDLHYLAQQHPDALYDIRGVFQRLAMDGCKYYLAVSAKDLLFFRAKEFAEPFTRFFDRFKLDTFDLEGTRNAITNPLRLSKSSIMVDEEVILRIHKLTQGHPYFIHFIMQDLVELKEKGALTNEFFYANYPKIAKHLAREKFDDDLHLASEMDQRVLFEMAKFNKTEVTPSELKSKSARVALRRLVNDKGLVKKNGRGRYHIYHPLFKQYLRIRGEQE